jgi:two-component system, OmpR family, sensor histidine kinase QseC
MTSTKRLPGLSVLSQPSLKRYLFIWLLAVQGAVWALLVATAWWTGQHEAQEVSDGQLIAVARAWWSIPADQQNLGKAKHSPPERVQEYVQDVAVMRWLDGWLTTNTDGINSTQLPPLPLGLSTIRFEGHDHAGAWRAYVVEKDTPQGVDRLAILMHMEHRIELANDMAAHMLYPALFALPLSIGLLMLALHRGLKPLNKLSHDIAMLGGQSDPSGQPKQRLGGQHGFSEFDSTVTALDELMDRLDAQLSREKAFASDVAHELRTPLASLSIHASRLACGHPSPDARALEQDALKAGAILKQLVTLARAESQHLQGHETLQLHTLLVHAMAEVGQTALESGHTLELLPDHQGAAVVAHALAVELAFSNVLRNALVHTPRGSRVVVSVVVSESQRGIQVEDWPSELLAEPAKTSDGLGLGLRLIERLMRSQKGKLCIEHKATGGRIVRLVWPVDASDQWNCP